jgi:hypothetical protein
VFSKLYYSIKVCHLSAAVYQHKLLRFALDPVITD